ncbi:hypothetical protein V7S43_004100 [Phytophthora oleae]|uniref:BZIP domain-containing protein n=1 Tax=Phytophthora oleae TaxID=2107226 RepID=A0ABD3FYU2_9STRA
MADAMFMDFLRSGDNAAIPGTELLQSLDKNDSLSSLPTDLQLDSMAFDGLSSNDKSPTSDSDCTSASVISSSSSPQNTSEVINIRSRDAVRRKTYREKKKAQRDALHEQAEKLSVQLSTLQTKKEATKAREGLGTTTNAVWKALADRNLQARRNAEEQKDKLLAAIEKRSALIRDLGELIRKRISEELLEDAGFSPKRLRTETPDKALYEAYISELDEIYAKADVTFKDTVVPTEGDDCEHTKLYYNPPHSTNKDATYHELVGSFSTPFAYERVSAHLHQVCCMAFRAGFVVLDEPWIPADTTITKCRIDGPLGCSIAQHCVMRRFNEGDRIVLVWRKLSEGEGMFGGLHSDETGWSIIRPSPSCVNGSVGSVLDMVSRFVPISFGEVVASSAAAKEFADMLIKDGEDICQLALQKLEKMLLDDALGVC